MDNETFYNKCAELLGVEHDYLPFEYRYRTRWTNPSQLPHVRENARRRMTNAPVLTCPHCGKEGNNKPSMM